MPEGGGLGIFSRQGRKNFPIPLGDIKDITQKTACNLLIFNTSIEGGVNESRKTVNESRKTVNESRKKFSPRVSGRPLIEQGYCIKIQCPFLPNPSSSGINSPQ